MRLRVDRPPGGAYSGRSPTNDRSQGANPGFARRALSGRRTQSEPGVTTSRGYVRLFYRANRRAASGTIGSFADKRSRGGPTFDTDHERGSRRRTRSRWPPVGGRTPCRPVRWARIVPDKRVLVGLAPRPGAPRPRAAPPMPCSRHDDLPRPPRRPCVASGAQERCTPQGRPGRRRRHGLVACRAATLHGTLERDRLPCGCNAGSGAGGCTHAGASFWSRR